MSLSRTLLCAGSALLFLTGSAALAAPDDATTYKLKLNHPTHEGDSSAYKSHCISSQNMTFSQSGKEMQSIHEFHELDCQIRERALKVSAQGKTVQTRAYLVAFRGRASESAPMAPLSLTGVTIEATLSPDLVLKRADGKPISEEEMTYLKLIFKRSDSDSDNNDDTVFGPPGPVKVGDTWKANSKVMVDGLAKSSHITLSPDNLTSEFTLASAEKIGGDTYLHVSGHVDADPISFPAPPPMQSALSGTMKMTFAKTIPADPSKSLLSDAISMEGTLRGKLDTPDAGPVDVAMTMKESETWTYLPDSKPNSK